MIITVTLNPAIDKTVEIKDFEAGKLNRVEKVRHDAGGKGINVSKVIRSLGGESIATGFLGRENGSFIVDYLNKLNIRNEFVFVEGETRTNLKIFDSSRKIVTEINEPGPYINENDIEELERILFKNANPGDIVVLTGSVPRNVDAGIYGRWIRKLRQNGVKTILDAEGALLKEGIKESPYLVKPNIYELEGLLGRRISGVEEAKACAGALVREHNIKVAVVSLGNKGAIYADENHSVFACGLEVDVKSTVGAGDAMVAALAYCMERKLGFRKSVTLSMAAATAKTMFEGSQPATLDSIMAIEKQIICEAV